MSCLEVCVRHNTPEKYSMCVVKEDMSVVGVRWLQWWLLMISCGPNLVLWSSGWEKEIFFQAIFG